MNETPTTERTRCRLCGGEVEVFLDLGEQPVSNAFLPKDESGKVAVYHLRVGMCAACTLVQQIEELPRDVMFNARYPYRTSGSAFMRAHFERYARHLLDTELAADGFLVELGCNDGVLLHTVSQAGRRHLGVEPSGQVAEIAAERGVDILVDFFDEETAHRIRTAHGPADIVYAANTLSHLSYLGSALRGIHSVLRSGGVAIIEDRYLPDVIENTYFDQIYDEHFYLLSARSMRAACRQHGLELVDVEPLSVHGGAMRYTLAHDGARQVSPAVGRLITDETRRGLADMSTYRAFADRVDRVRRDLHTLLTELRDAGRSVVGYGATSKSATVTRLCGIGPELVPYIYDSTPEKQGCMAPGSNIEVRPAGEFRDRYPDYALLFAWNHAEEIMAKEQEFTAGGGRWIFYVPRVHVVGGAGVERSGD